ncbi:MAG: hypothetical protein ACTSQO_12710 [Candidatus Helarchaeota archaeon]
MIIIYKIHEVVAISGCNTISVTACLYGVIEYRKSAFPKILAISSIITDLLFCIFILGFIIVEYIIITPQKFVYAVEWSAFFSLFFWLIAHGIYFIKQK